MRPGSVGSFSSASEVAPTRPSGSNTTSIDRIRNVRTRILLSLRSCLGARARPQKTGSRPRWLGLDDALGDPLVAHLDIRDHDLVTRLELGQRGDGALLHAEGDLHRLLVHEWFHGHGLEIGRAHV